MFNQSSQRKMLLAAVSCRVLQPNALVMKTSCWIEDDLSERLTVILIMFAKVRERLSVNK
jgi:hypothetical protein